MDSICQHIKHTLIILSCLIQLAWAPTGLANTQWKNLLDSSQRETELETVHAINKSINRLLHRTDQRVWSKNEYWATPYELLSKGAGDCEDFAIAKYFALAELGVAQERITLLWSRLYNPNKQRIEPHIVMLYQSDPHSEYLVLDNMNERAIKLSHRQDLLPQLRFDKYSTWKKGIKNEWVQALPARQQLTVWHDVLKRWTEQKRNANRLLALQNQP